MIAIWAMRCIAEVQIVPADQVFWAANLATGLVFGVQIFAATLLCFLSDVPRGEKQAQEDGSRVRYGGGALKRAAGASADSRKRVRMSCGKAQASSMRAPSAGASGEAATSAAPHDR